MADALAWDGTLNQHDVFGGGPAGASAAIYTAQAELCSIVIDKRLAMDALGITDHISDLLCTHVKRAVIAAADGVRATLELGAVLQ